MAFERRYESTYFSLNGRQYYLEIRDQNWPSGIGVKEADLGVGGCAIHYDMEGEQKYSPIIASKMEIPFLVKDGTDAVFIKNLIEDYNEGDVVVALYIGSSATYAPLWAGYLLMDLGAQQDVGYPYEVKLTATDGLARLKDIGFWDDEAAELTYTHKGHERITYWLGEILNKLTPPSTTQGISTDAKIRAAVNWYNEEHQSAGTTFGPLYQTQIKMGMMEDRDTGGNPSVRNCYEVLTHLCVTLGMRCIYWKNSFYFVQLDGYNTAESGTLVNPTNINTRDYSLADPPVHTASNDYLGSTWWTRYNQDIENLTTPSKGIQKLAGTTYQNYPILKRVSADFISANDQNYYRGFPESTPGPNDTGGAGDIVKVVQQFMNDPQSATKILLRVPLTFQQDTTVGSFNSIFSNYTAKFYCYIKATVPTGATGTGTDPQYLKYSGGSYSWTATLPTWGDFILLQTQSLTASSTGVQMLTPFNSNGGQLPPLTGVTGTWKLEIIVQAYNQNGSWKDPIKIQAVSSPFTTVNAEDYTIHGVKWANAFNTSAGVITNHSFTNPNGITYQQWTSANGNPFMGELYLLNSSLSVASLGTKVISETNKNDTSQLFLGQMFWGDSPMDSDPASMLVWNGSAWVFTDPTGDWGVGTITPSSPVSLTKLLLKEYLDGQSFHVYKMNARITLSAHNKSITDASGTRPKYINPIGRINDVDGKSYVFLRGTFTTGDDTWDGEWFNIGRGTPTISTTTQNIFSLNTPATSSSLPMPMITGGSGNASAKLAAPLAITTTSARISAADVLGNGQFTTDTDWTKGTGVTIADDKLKFSSVNSGVGALSVTDTVTAGKQYNVQFTVADYSSGGVYVKLGNTAGTTVTANGDYNQNITPESTTTIQLLSSTSTSTLNIEGIIIIERITSIPIVDIGETLLADDDRITLVDSNSGEVHELRLNAAQTSGDTALTIDTYTFEEDVETGAFISINERNLIQQYQNKTEGTIHIPQYSLSESSSDPSDPAEGNAVIWMSDGTASGDDGDIIAKIKAGGVIKRFNIVDFSSFTNTYSLAFDGVDDYVNLGSNSSLQPAIASGITLSLWGKWEDITAGSTAIMFSTSSNASAYNGVYVAKDTSGRISLTTGIGIGFGSTSRSTAYTPSTPLSNDTWHHMVFVWVDAAKANWKIYVDGVEITPLTTSGSGVGVVYTANDALIGRRTGSSGGSNLYMSAGLLDEISYWSKALSAEEIVSIYNGGKPNNLEGLSGLVGWWRDGDSATYPIIPDDSTNSNTGTMTNMVAGDINPDVP